ncbi:MAG: hypothetical protein ACRDUT_00110 [Mycobacterium sp.]
MTTAAQRKELEGLCRFLLSHRAQLDYPTDDVRGALDAATFKLSREQAIAHLKAGKRLMFDCSAFWTCVYKWSGLKDPNGLAYQHEGYTGTMLARLPHYTDAKLAGIGALATFGPGTADHVSGVLEPDTKHGSPLMLSHGRSGLDVIRLLDEAKQHRPPVTLLNVSRL